MLQLWRRRMSALTYHRDFDKRPDWYPVEFQLSNQRLDDEIANIPFLEDKKKYVKVCNRAVIRLKKFYKDKNWRINCLNGWWETQKKKPKNICLKRLLKWAEVYQFNIQKDVRNVENKDTYIALAFADLLIVSKELDNLELHENGIDIQPCYPPNDLELGFTEEEILQGA